MVEVVGTAPTSAMFITKFVYRRSWKTNMNNIKLYFKDSIYLLNMSLTEQQKKEITDILESIYEKDYAKINIDASIGHNLKKHLKSLKKKMKEAAENLEFEEAAKIRDEIRKLEASELEIGINPKIRQSKLQNKIYPEGRSTQGKPGTKPKRKR